MKKMLLLFVFVGMVNQVIASAAGEEPVAPAESPEVKKELVSAAQSSSPAPVVDPVHALAALSVADQSGKQPIAVMNASAGTKDAEAEDAEDVSTQS